MPEPSPITNRRGLCPRDGWRGADRRYGWRVRAWPRIPPTPMGRDGGFGTPAIITSASPYLMNPSGVANGVRAGGAGGTGGLVGAFGVVADADLPGSKVDDGRGNEEG